MTEKKQILWQRCMEMFRSNVSEQQFQTWFSPMRLKSFDAAKKELAVYIPSQFFFEYLEEHFRRLIHITISRFFGEDIKLIYQVEVADNVTVGQESEDTAPATARSSREANKSPLLEQAVGMADDLDSQLNVHQSFSNFIEGTSNKLPRSVGQAIAEHPEQMTFNPLFIYGPSGVGKTHLVNAIGLRTKELHPEKRVLYLSAHLFMVQFTDARKNNVFNDFMHFYQSIDMLIVDDIQELAGTKVATQNAFFHIFNHLRLNDKQIIMTCDRPPVSLQGMEERLVTRFKSGLMAEMEKPEESLRRNILRSIVKHDGLNIPDNVLDFISTNVNNSVRELEGIIHSLLAYSVVYGKEIDLDFAKRILAGRTRVEKKNVTIDQIITTTCEHFNVKEEDIFGKSRKAEIVTVRQMSMYLAHKHTKLTASKIGIYVGNRDHATVLHGIKTIDGRLKKDSKLLRHLEELEEKLIGKAL